MFLTSKNKCLSNDMKIFGIWNMLLYSFNCHCLLASFVKFNKKDVIIGKEDFNAYLPYKLCCKKNIKTKIMLTYPIFKLNVTANILLSAPFSVCDVLPCNFLNKI